MTTRKLSYVLYGVRSADLKKIRDSVARALGREFGGHDSEYWDIYYTTKGTVEPEIEIQRNWDFSEGSFHLPQYKEFKIVISVDDADDHAAIDEALTSDPRIDATLLEHHNAFPEKTD